MTLNPFRARRERREAELEELAQFRFVRKIVDEDVTVFGEELGELHVETMTDVLDEEAREDYRAALTSYDAAKQALHDATDAAQVAAVDTLLDDGRFRLACVLARRDGRELPVRRDPCFFNPQHGPASRDVRWTPPMGVEREIPVCFRCVEQLAGGAEPDQRLIKLGDRWVPWYAAGGSIMEVSRVQAHVVRGNAWRSRTHEAEALIKAAAQQTQGGGFPF